MTTLDTRLPGLLKGNKPLFGMFVGIASPAIVEMCGHAGFDFVILDNEHGPASIETTEHLIRAARCVNVIPIVRTLEADILRILDIGASGIQVPQVNTAEQARRIVAAAKYPPVGNRGAAFSPRAAGYGFFGGPAHAKASNEGIGVILMIETREALGQSRRNTGCARYRCAVHRSQRFVVRDGTRRKSEASGRHRGHRRGHHENRAQQSRRGLDDHSG